MKDFVSYMVEDKQYGQEIYLLIGDEERAKQHIMKIENANSFNASASKAMKESRAVCLYGKNGEIFIWMREFSPTAEFYSVLMHEVLHAITYHSVRCHTEPHLTHDNIYWAEMVYREFLKKLLN